MGKTRTVTQIKKIPRTRIMKNGMTREGLSRKGNVRKRYSEKRNPESGSKKEENRKEIPITGIPKKRDVGRGNNKTTNPENKIPQELNS